eukprot:5197622-Prymnesium_polylepis.1
MASMGASTAAAAAAPTSDLVDEDIGAAAALEARALQQATRLRSRLQAALAAEAQRSRDAARRNATELEHLAGHVALASAAVAYGGPLSWEQRAQLQLRCVTVLTGLCVPLLDVYAQPLDVHSLDQLAIFIAGRSALFGFEKQQLPTDRQSVRSGVIASTDLRFPMLIDPQGQGRAWVRKREAACKLRVTSLVAASGRGAFDSAGHDKVLAQFHQILEDALSFGQPILLEECGQDGALLGGLRDSNPLECTIWRLRTSCKALALGAQRLRFLSLRSQDSWRGASRAQPRFHDPSWPAECEWAPSFHVTFATQHPSPPLSPELFAVLNVCDFTVTSEGLEHQLMYEVIAGVDQGSGGIPELARPSLSPPLRREGGELRHTRHQTLSELEAAHPRLCALEEDLLEELLAWLSAQEGATHEETTTTTTLVDASLREKASSRSRGRTQPMLAEDDSTQPGMTASLLRALETTSHLAETVRSRSTSLVEIEDLMISQAEPTRPIAARGVLLECLVRDAARGLNPM